MGFHVGDITWTRFLCGWLIPTGTIICAIILPLYLCPHIVGHVYSAEFIAALIISLVSIVLFNTKFKDWFIRHEDGIGWCVQCCMSFAMPPALIASIGILDYSKDIGGYVNFNMSYIIAGAIIYYALRLQSHFFAKEHRHRYILPIGIILATLVIYIFDEQSIWILVVGLCLMIVNILLNGKACSWCKDTPEIDVDDYNNTLLKRTYCNKIQAAINDLEEFIDSNSQLNSELSCIKLPQPKLDSNKQPYIDFIESLGRLPKDSSRFASLEQLILSVSPSFSIDNWLQHIDTTGLTTKDVTINGIKILNDSKDVVNDLIHEHSAETLMSLTDHVMHRLYETCHSTLFRKGLQEHMEHSIKDGIVYVSQKIGKDSALGIFDHIRENIPAEDMDNFIASIDALKDSAKNYAESLMPTSDDVDISIDMDSHFPFITSVLEGVRLLDKSRQGDVDMASAFTKSATKVGGRAGGAFVGGVIGSFLFPGVGSIVGSMIGSWLGGNIAREINMQKFNELKEAFEIAQKELEHKSEEATLTITNKQKDAANNLNVISSKVNNDFSEVSQNSPLKEFDIQSLKYSLSIVVRSYLLYLLIHESDKSIRIQLASDIPSVKDCKEDPNCLYKMIESKSMRDVDAYLTLSNLINCITTEIRFRHSQLLVIQTLWINHVRVKYIECMNSLLKKSEDIFEDVNETISLQRDIIEKQLDLCKSIAKKAENEAKTL